MYDKFLLSMCFLVFVVPYIAAAIISWQQDIRDKKNKEDCCRWHKLHHNDEDNL